MIRERGRRDGLALEMNDFQILNSISCSVPRASSPGSKILMARIQNRERGFN